MAKELAVVLNDGSLEAAVATALAGQKYRVALVHVSGGGAAAGPKQRATEEQGAAIGAVKVWVPAVGTLEPEKLDGPPGAANLLGHTVQGEMLRLLAGYGVAARAAAVWGAAAVYLPLRVGPGDEELAKGTEFVQICNELLQLPCGQEGIEVVAPLLELEPWQVVDLGVQTGAALEKSWSCESGGETPCGQCKGCLARQGAFQRAAKPDPQAGARR